MPQIILALTLLFSAFLPLAAQPADPEGEALRLLNLLAEGQYETAVQNFDPVMAERLPAPRLEAVWNETITNYGAFQQAGEVQVQPAGAYTAANIRAQFAAAQVNVRVVFNQAGQVSGLFVYPLETTRPVSPLFTAALAFSALFAILFPLVLAVIARRRLGVGWKYFFYGAGIFFLFQLVTRLPIIAVLQAGLGQYINSSSVLLLLWLVFLSFSAGLFEEFGRYVGYRWLMPNDPKTWAVAVMFGLGHGGIESMLLVGVNNLASTALIFFYPLLSNILPGQQMAPVLQQLAAFSLAPDWLPLLAAWERLWTIFFHVALSVLVLQVFRRGSMRWLWLAIGLHGAANLIIVGLPTLLRMPRETTYLFSAVMLALVGLLALWIIRRFRAET
jgi:uncharacterized membrane protein YhfC